MADTVQVGDIGTKIILDCVEDISAQTEVKIMYQKPKGTSGEWAAVYAAGTTTIYYITEVSDLDEAGCWCLQAYVNLNDVWIGRGEVAQLEVSHNV